MRHSNYWGINSVNYFIFQIVFDMIAISLKILLRFKLLGVKLYV